MGERQKNGALRLLFLADDAPRHDVARREVAARVIARHERVAAAVDQARAFAAKRLGNQKTRRALQVEGGWMELDELEIGNPGTGMIRERDAIAGGHRGVGRLAEHLARPAGGEQRGAGAELLTLPGSIEECHSRDRAVFDEQLGDQRVMNGLDRRQTADALPERAADLAPGRVAGMQHAPDAVRRFPSERRASGSHRDRNARPTRAARARSPDPLRQARARPARRTTRRRHESCRRRAAPGCLRRRLRRRCRPARSRYCFRWHRLSSGPRPARRTPAQSRRVVPRFRRRRSGSQCHASWKASRLSDAGAQ